MELFHSFFAAKNKKKILTDPEINSEPTIKVLEIIHNIYLTLLDQDIYQKSLHGVCYLIGLDRDRLYILNYFIHSFGLIQGSKWLRGN